VHAALLWAVRIIYLKGASPSRNILLFEFYKNHMPAMVFSGWWGPTPRRLSPLRRISHRLMGLIEYCAVQGTYTASRTPIDKSERRVVVYSMVWVLELCPN
jgi:hypothetical protein